MTRIFIRLYKDVNTHWDLTVALKVKALKKLRAFAFYFQISDSFFISVYHHKFTENYY